MLSLFLPWIPFKEISSVHTTTVVYNRDKSRKDPVSHLAVRMSDRQDSWRVIVEMGCEIFKQRVKRTLLALRNIDLCFNKSVLSSFPVAQMVKCLPAMQETQVRFLGQEDPLEKEMATDFSILAWKTPWTVAYMDCRLHGLSPEEPDRRQSMELQRLGHDWATERLHFIVDLCLCLLIILLIP